MIVVLVFLFLICLAKPAESGPAAAVHSRLTKEIRKLSPISIFPRTTRSLYWPPFSLHHPSSKSSDMFPRLLKFHTYSVAEALQSVLCSVHLESAELHNHKRKSSEALADLTRPIAQYYSPISPAKSAALSFYLPTRTAECFSLISITFSILSFCISFTFFGRQWRRLFAHPKRFFQGTSGRFLHIVDGTPSTDKDSSFLYLSVSEFKVLQALVQAALQ